MLMHARYLQRDALVIQALDGLPLLVRLCLDGRKQPLLHMAVV